MKEEQGDEKHMEHAMLAHMILENAEKRSMFFVFGSESKVLLLDWAMLERMVDVVSTVPI